MPAAAARCLGWLGHWLRGRDRSFLDMNAVVEVTLAKGAGEITIGKAAETLAEVQAADHLALVRADESAISRRQKV